MYAELCIVVVSEPLDLKMIIVLFLYVCVLVYVTTYTYVVCVCMYLCDIVCMFACYCNYNISK